MLIGKSSTELCYIIFSSSTERDIILFTQSFSTIDHANTSKWFDQFECWNIICLGRKLNRKSYQ